MQIDSPENIYRQPFDAFVAHFRGVAGEIAASALGEVAKRRDQVVLPLAKDQCLVAHAFEQFVPGAPAGLFVRAVGVTLRNAVFASGVKGRIRDVAINGRGFEHVVIVGEGALFSKVCSISRFDRGALTKVVFDPSTCFIMDPKKGS